MTTISDPTLLGLPSEAELANLAQGYLSDIDPNICLNGIANLADGDSALLESRFETKAGQVNADLNNYFGADQKIIDDVLSLDPFNVTNQQPSGSKGQNAVSYSPKILSEKESKQYAENAAGVNYGSVPAPVNKSSIVVGNKSIEQIRADFPILTTQINGNQLIWFDNGATTQRPQVVIDRLVQYYTTENSNVHRAAHQLAARSTDAYEDARQKVADFIGAPSKNDIVWVRGTTEGINLVAHSFVKPRLQPGDEIIVSILEHHANIVPWQLVAAETGAVIKVIPVDSKGDLLIHEYEQLFTPRTKFVSVAHVSNTLGTITPIEELIHIAHRHNVPILIDAAQSIAHLPINVSASDADFLVFSGHKMYGPNGIGAVYGKSAYLEEAKPYHGGGNMIKDVTFERTIYNPAPNKFEAGTGSIADAVGLGAAIDYLSEIGMGNVAKYEHELTQYAVKELSKVKSLHLVGLPLNKSGVLSFVLDGHSITEVGEYLDKYGIAVRAGHHCAQPVLRHYGYEGTIRPVLGLYNTPDEVDTLVKALYALV